MNAKQKLRQEMKALRENLDAETRKQVDAAIADKVKELPQYAIAPAIATYLSVGSEVDTREIIRSAWSDGKIVTIPRCIPDERAMEWHVIESFDELEQGPFGIEEPAPDPLTLIDPTELGPLSIALVPALSYDAFGFRLGYGGGYYDAFLPRFPGISIGLCRNIQMSTIPLPVDLNDVPVGFVVTESGAV